MAWELFGEWADLQFVNYTISEEFEDGTIGAWRMEDWEIYGPGAGGYSSSGPYGNWEDDIRAWLENGSLIAEEIIDWDASQLQSHNLSEFTRESARLNALTTYYLNGMSYLPQDPNPTFGESGSGAKYAPGDIVVTGVANHADQSRTYRFASFDPYTHQTVSWVENATFLQQAAANADVNVIRFDLANGEPQLTADEQNAVVTIRSAVQDRIASLRQLDPNSYFEVDGWGRIRVSELISLLMRADWVIHPATHFQPTDVGYVDRHGGDPELEINRSKLLGLASDTALLDFYIIHELVHATRRGWDHRHDNRVEVTTNDVAAAILYQMGRPIDKVHNSFGTTSVGYFSGVPGT